MKIDAPSKTKKPRSARRQGVYIRIPEKLHRSVQELAAARRVPLQAIYEAGISHYFCPREPGTDEERKIVTEKGARRFDRFEQWLMRHLVDPESLYSRLQGRVTP